MAGLRRDDLPADPFKLWREWLADAEAAGLVEPNAMVLATVDRSGVPSVRTVLCKEAADGGFVFYTNYESRKGVAIDGNPRVALLFPWHSLSRQVIVDGTAAPLPAGLSDEYFASRPRGAQLSALASAQSRPIDSRAQLEQRVAELADRYADQPVPRPAHWGGYQVRPDRIEFWHGRPDRLHDRLRYVRAEDRWTVERLQP